MTLADEGLGRITGQVTMVAPPQLPLQSQTLQGDVVRLTIR